jgi:signal peptidase I
VLSYIRKRRFEKAQETLDKFYTNVQSPGRRKNTRQKDEKVYEKASNIAKKLNLRVREGQWWLLKRPTKKLSYYTDYLLGLRKSMFRETAELIIFSFLLALFIRAHFIQAFKIPSGSMEDTLLVGDFLLVDKVTYGVKTPERIPVLDIQIPSYRFPSIREPRQGDVIVFKYPVDQKTDFIKRCIATEGQTVEIINKKIYVDGRRLHDPPQVKYTRSWSYPRDFKGSQTFQQGIGSLDNMGPIDVPKDCLFVMGDNRDNSSDSRSWGFVPIENVRGRALFIYWSWDRWIPRLNRIGDIIR